MVGAILSEEPPARATTAGPALSVVVCTWENPDALELSLTSLARQTRQDFEIIVADDGSGETTAGVIANFARRSRLPTLHLWQAHRGPRKCTLLNRAIVAARGPYLLFLDGDCLLPRHAIAAHLRLRRPGCWLAGGTVLLGREATRSLDRAQVDAGATEGWRALALRARRSRRLLAGLVPGLAALLDGLALRRPVGWRGGHSSAGRNDLLAVAGFDERFGLGLEDKDLAQRLRVAGLAGRSIRYRVPMLHLDHERPASQTTQIESNQLLLAENRRAGVSRTAFGIAAADAAPIEGSLSAAGGREVP